MFRVCACVVQIGFVQQGTRSKDLFLSCNASEVWSSSAVAGQWVITEGGREDINRACNSVRAGAFHSQGG